MSTRFAIKHVTQGSEHIAQTAVFLHCRPFYGETLPLWDTEKKVLHKNLGCEGEKADQKEEKGVVTIAITNTLSNLDLVVEALKLASGNWKRSMCSQPIQPLLFQDCKAN